MKARNGQILDGPFDVKGRGRIAVVRDPEGAELVLIHAYGGDPSNSDVKSGQWLWVDLITRDARGANAFYKALAGYTAQTINTETDHSYNLLFRDGRALAGVVELPLEEVEPNWLPYIKVDDITTTINRALKLGGSLLLRLEQVAVIADPTGGVFGIQMVRGDAS